MNKFLQICFRDLRIFTDFMAQKSKNDRHFWTVWPIEIFKSERNKSVDIYKGSYKPSFRNLCLGSSFKNVHRINFRVSQFYDFAHTKVTGESRFSNIITRARNNIFMRFLHLSLLPCDFNNLHHCNTPSPLTGISAGYQKTENAAPTW